MRPENDLANDGKPSADADTAMPESSVAKRHALVKAMRQLQENVRGRSQPYKCFLDEQPSELVPWRARERERLRPDDTGLIVNSSLYFQVSDRAPAEVPCPVPFSSAFLRNYPIAWIKDPGTGVWMPFWPGGKWADLMLQLEPGQPAPSALPPAMRKSLEISNILVARDHDQSCIDRWAGTCMTAQAQFLSKGYAIVQDLIHPSVLGATREYYRGLIASGGLPLGDSQVAERHQLGNEHLASFFHTQIADLVSRIAGEPVKPSYVYLASYRAGAVLPPHVDREQCEFSISFLVDYVPDPDGPCGWPLFLEKPGQPETLYAADLGVGDALFYRGRELIHYRNALPERHQSTSLFFHYVREQFSGRLW